MQSMIHRETLASKTVGPELIKVLMPVIWPVNTVKSSAFHTRSDILLNRWMQDDYSLL